MCTVSSLEPSLLRYYSVRKYFYLDQGIDGDWIGLFPPFNPETQVSENMMHFTAKWLLLALFHMSIYSSHEGMEIEKPCWSVYCDPVTENSFNNRLSFSKIMCLLH